MHHPNPPHIFPPCPTLPIATLRTIISCLPDLIRPDAISTTSVSFPANSTINQAEGSLRHNAFRTILHTCGFTMAMPPPLTFPHSRGSISSAMDIDNSDGHVHSPIVQGGSDNGFLARLERFRQSDIDRDNMIQVRLLLAVSMSSSSSSSLPWPQHRALPQTRPPC